MLGNCIFGFHLRPSSSWSIRQIVFNSSSKFKLRGRPPNLEARLVLESCLRQVSKIWEPRTEHPEPRTEHRKPSVSRCVYFWNQVLAHLSCILKYVYLKLRCLIFMLFKQFWASFCSEELCFCGSRDSKSKHRGGKLAGWGHEVTH